MSIPPVDFNHGLLACLGNDWDVVPRTEPEREAPWRLARRLPVNATVVSRARALRGLARGEYDLVVAQGLPDLEDASVGKVPVLYIVTGSPELARTLGVIEPLKERLRATAGGAVTSVFLSETRRREWDLGGEVVPLGLDIEAYGPYSGRKAGVLVVARLATLLPETADVSLFERATAGLPVTQVSGVIPNAPDQGASGRPWILDAYAQHRVFLDTTPVWCRDGQHLSVLEAMASGQPVVTIPKPDSPVVNGTNGFVEADPWRLHQRLLELLGDERLARTLGASARHTIATQFPAARFREGWDRLIEGTAQRHIRPLDLAAGQPV